MKTAPDALDAIRITRPDMLAAVLAAGTAPAEQGVLAAINHARWVVSCPACNGAQFGAPSDPRFMCVDCWNAAVGGSWRPVTFPVPVEREALEVELQRRPLPDYRNWDPGQSVEDLAAELEAFNQAQAAAAAAAAEEVEG